MEPGQYRLVSLGYPGYKGYFAHAEALNRKARRWARLFPRLCNWEHLEESLEPPKRYSYYIPEGGGFPELWVYTPGGRPVYVESFSLCFQTFEGYGEHDEQSRGSDDLHTP